ncbi:MAG: SpoIIE family protein phosphatase [Bacteroidia bacterium]|nr:SpoIIE family protein phosphatase [Bacteroidia bacterium]
MHIELTSSIQYAKRIQTAVLPGNNFLNEIFTSGEYFILYKPRDIVSGDFYWATRINEWLIFTIADCTGHGVPGGFMSMLGISFLNEIINKDEITQANQALNELRTYIIKSLQQHEDIDNINNSDNIPKNNEIRSFSDILHVKDGMDMTLCALDTSNNVLQYSGANNSLFIVTQRDLQSVVPQYTSDSKIISVISDNQNNYRLIEIKGDKMPVAIHLRMDTFTNHIIRLEKGDILYLMSDGFQDQFGGPNGKKFKTIKLKELLLSITSEPMEQQKDLLDNAIEQWKSHTNKDTGVHYEQTDDITVMGVKI